MGQIVEGKITSFEDLQEEVETTDTIEESNEQ